MTQSCNGWSWAVPSLCSVQRLKVEKVSPQTVVNSRVTCPFREATINVGGSCQCVCPRMISTSMSCTEPAHPVAAKTASGGMPSNSMAIAS
jgi:hypothetical protein